MRDPLTALRDALGRDPMSPWRRRLRRLIRPAWLAPFRTTPLSSYWGLDRGTPVDRYYVERFLAENSRDIRGRVVELQDTQYTDRFGAGVERRDVLDINPGNPAATIVADLTAAEGVPANSFDCFVLTQTLQFIYDVRAAVTQVHRMLRPGGIFVFGQDLSNDKDVEFHPYDVGHPIRLAREDVDRHLADLEVLLRKDLSREEGRDPRLHYATLIYAGRVPNR